MDTVRRTVARVNYTPPIDMAARARMAEAALQLPAESDCTLEFTDKYLKITSPNLKFGMCLFFYKKSKADEFEGLVQSFIDHAK